MHIGLCHEAAGTRHAGGVAVYVQHLAAELARSHEVTLYTQAGDRTEVLAASDASVVETPSFDGHAIHRLAPVSPLDRQNLTKLAMHDWLRRSGLLAHLEATADVLCTFQFLDDLVLSTLVDVPTVFQYHSLGSVGPGTRLRERFSRTDCVLANSPDTAARIEAELGYAVDGVVTPGVDVERFRPGVDHAFTSDRPTVLFVGRVVEAKGVFDLLDALSHLDDAVELVVVGSGETDRVARRSRALGIADRVRVLGEVPQVDLPGYYAAADAFCLPSHAESFGMANLEAMAAGTPVVTTALDAIESYVTDGEHGRLIPPGDRPALTRALESVLDDADSRATMGRQARARAREYSWEGTATEFARACAEVVDDDARTATPRRAPVVRPR